MDHLPENRPETFKDKCAARHFANNIYFNNI